MARKSKEVVEVLEDVETTTTNIEPTKEVSVPKTTKKTYPEVGTNRKFHYVAFEGGFVVYNPAGQRATGIITETEAKDVVLKNNIAGGLK